MKIRIHRLCTLTLISLLSLFAFAALAAAQGPISNQLSRSPEKRGETGKTHKARAATTGSGYHYEVLYNFGSSSTDAWQPASGLIQDATGNFYGTTAFGGAKNAGTVFKIDSTGLETVLYSFCSVANCTDGSYAKTGLVRDTEGNLYGTTSQGGAYDKGTVFKVDNTGNETVLYNFCPAGCVDGQYPEAGLIRDTEGNLYGTTSYGGANNSGAVFKLDSTNQETVLYSFCSVSGCKDGVEPWAGLIQDAAGNLYGTTISGGAHNAGTVFELDTAGHETVLYSFCSVGGANCTDGAQPYAGLIEDAAGNLYGTTVGGGSNDSACISPAGGCGTVFKLDTTSHETVLYNFCSVGGANCTDGEAPYAGLVRDAAGNLYGTTDGGGNSSVTCGTYGCGTAFKLDTTGQETVLYSFCSVGGTNCTDGWLVAVGLIQDAAGNLYGTTYGGGANNGGTAFELALPNFTVAGTAVSASPGATSGNTSTITLTPSGGFTGSVTLTAAITSGPAGAQDPPSVSFGATSPVSITGGSAVTATMTITTTAPTNAALARPAYPGVRWYGGGMTLAFGLIFGMGIPARRRSWRTRLGALVFLVVLIGGLLACGSSGSGGGGGGNPGTTPGTYTVTVTGTSGSTTATGSVTLNVQ